MSNNYPHLWNEPNFPLVLVWVFVQVVFWARGTGIGGSSNLNYMIYQRGNPRDYDRWANWTQNPVWSSSNVNRVFKELEDYDGSYPNDKIHGNHGPLRIEKLRQTYMKEYFLNAAKEKGFEIHDTNSGNGQDFGELDLTTKDGMRWSTYSAFIKPILRRRNLTLSRYSRVVKIHLDKQRHAYGVTYYRHGLKKFVRARREIILSAGAVDTPKLLLLSGIGPREHLHSIGLKCRLNLPVGLNLQDHLFAVVGPFLFHDNVTESLHIQTDANLQRLLAYNYNRTGPLGALSGLSSIGFLSTFAEAKNHKWPDIQFFQMGIGIPEIVPSLLARILNFEESPLQEFLKEAFGRHTNLISLVLARPKSVGAIQLKGQDPFLKPLINPNYLHRKEDTKAMIYGMKFIIDLYENSTTYAKIGGRLLNKPFPTCAQFEFRSDNYYDCYVRTLTQTLFHPAGSVAMGPSNYLSSEQTKKNATAGNADDDPIPVLDSQLRVFRTSGLRVMDASVMPFIVNSNTNGPCIAIGQIGSQLVREYWTQHSAISPNNPETRFLYQNKIKQCMYSRIY